MVAQGRTTGNSRADSSYAQHVAARLEFLEGVAATLVSLAHDLADDPFEVEIPLSLAAVRDCLHEAGALLADGMSEEAYDRLLSAKDIFGEALCDLVDIGFFSEDSQKSSVTLEK